MDSAVPHDTNWLVKNLGPRAGLGTKPAPQTTQVLITIDICFKKTRIDDLSHYPNGPRSTKKFKATCFLLTRYVIHHHPPPMFCEKLASARWVRSCIISFLSNLSGQIIIFHQPKFPWNKGISLTKPPFGVRSCEVAIIWPLGSPSQMYLEDFPRRCFGSTANDALL